MSPKRLRLNPIDVELHVEQMTHAGITLADLQGLVHRLERAQADDASRRPAPLLRAPVCFVLSDSFGGIYGFLPWNTVFGVSGQTCGSGGFSTLRVEKTEQHHLCGCCVRRCIVLG